MDKEEFRLKLEEINRLVADKDYEGAMNVVDSIDWRRVRNVRTLCVVGEIYAANRRYEDSREIFLLAYHRAPIGKNILYRLIEISLKLGEIEDAEEYFREFMEVASKDNTSYILKYKIQKAKNDPLDEQIQTLEKFKDSEFTEKWGYELAYLYYQADEKQKCMDLCSEMALWFSDSPYVLKALELKKRYGDLSESEKELYEKMTKGEDKSETTVKQDHTDEGKEQDSGESDAGKGAEEESSHSSEKQISSEKEEITDDESEESVRIGSIKVKSDRDLAGVESFQDKLSKGLKDIFSLKKEQEDEEDDGREGPAESDSADIPQEDIPQEEETDKDDSSAETESEQAAEDSVKPVIKTEDRSVKVTNLEESILAAASRQGIEIPPERSRKPSPAYLEEEEFLSEEDLAAAEQEFLNGPQKKEESTVKVSSVETEKTDAQQTEETEENAEEEITQEDDSPAETSQEDEVTEETKEDGEEDEEIQENAEEKESADENTQENQSVEKTEESDPSAKENQESESEDYEEKSGSETVSESEEIYGEKSDSETGGESEEIYDDEESDEEYDEEELQEALEKRHFDEMLIQSMDEEDRQEEKGSDEENLDEEEKLERFVDSLEKPDRVSPLEIIPRENVLTEDEVKLFSYFVRVPGMKEQLIDTLLDVQEYAADKTSSRGNVIVMGGRETGKTTLISSLIPAICQELNLEAVKVAYVFAEDINGKNIPAVIHKLWGGFLVIEDANQLDADTVDQLSFTMDQETGRLFVILEDEKIGMRKFIARYPKFARKFTSMINIPIFTNDELVNFARFYTVENGYKIDQLGMLALYNQIGENQKEDQPMNIGRVKDLLDAAIAKAERGLIKINRRKRMDRDGYFTLYEKDFM